MTRVILESPYAGRTAEEIAANVAYGRACLRDCIRRGEAPIASHLLLTLDGVLRDEVVEERALGMKAGWAWIVVAEKMVVYTDRGISDGMRLGIRLAREMGVPVEERVIPRLSPA